MKNLYASPYARLARRFVIVGISATLAFLATKVDTTNPLLFIDGILAFSGKDFFDLLKVFMGAGFLAMLDKLRREWGNVISENS